MSLDNWVHIPPSCSGRLNSYVNKWITGLCTFPFIDAVVLIIVHSQQDKIKPSGKTLIHLEEFDDIIIIESINFELNEMNDFKNSFTDITMIIHEKNINDEKRTRKLLSRNNITYTLIVVPTSDNICGLAVPIHGKPLLISTSEIIEWISMPNITEKPKYTIIRHPNELEICLTKAISFGINQNKDVFSPCIMHNGFHWELSPCDKDHVINQHLNKFMLSFDDNASLKTIHQKLCSIFHISKSKYYLLYKACLSAKILKNIKRDNHFNVYALFNNLIYETVQLLKVHKNIAKDVTFHQLINNFDYTINFAAESQITITVANIFDRDALTYYRQNDFINAKKHFWNALIRHSLVYCTPSNELLCAHYNYAASCQNASSHINASNHIRMAFWINEKLLIKDLQNIQLIQRKVTILRRLQQYADCISKYVEKGETYLKCVINYKHLTLRKKGYKQLCKLHRLSSICFPFASLIDMKTKYLNLETGKECEQCHAKEYNKNLKCCAKCKAVYFCSKHCQKISWKYNHRYLCVI